MNKTISEETENMIWANCRQLKEKHGPTKVKGGAIELEILKAKLVKEWLSDFELWSENQTARDPNYCVINHLCSSASCAQEKRIELIDSETQFYVCTRSGFYHFCKGKNDCLDRSVNMDLEIVCAFSGIVVDINLTDWRQDASKNGGNQDDDSLCMEVCDSNEEGEGDGEGDGVGVAINREYSMPLPEERPKRRSRGKKTQGGIFIKSQTDDLTKQIRLIVHDLLYNTKERERLNEIKKRSMKKQAETNVKKYFKTMKNEKTRPCRPFLEDKFAHYMFTKKLLGELPHNQIRVTIYANFILIIYNYIRQSSYYQENMSRFHIKHHTLACLYLFCNPFSISKNHQLPKDDFLIAQLPHLNDLVLWKGDELKLTGYKKSHITKGKNNIRKSFNSISDDHMLQKIFLDLEKYSELLNQQDQ